MGTIIGYHCAYAKDREQIEREGLHDRHPVTGVSGAQEYGNAAGPAVYMWSWWGEHMRVSRNTDVWAVELDERDVHADPSELGALGAVYTKVRVTPDMLTRIGDDAGSRPGLLRPIDIRDPRTAAAWAAASSHEVVKAMVARDRSLTAAWIGRWDEDWDHYTPEHIVALEQRHLTGTAPIELEDLRKSQPIVHSYVGATTVDDLLINLYPLSSYSTPCFAPPGWEWALMGPEQMSAKDRAWHEREMSQPMSATAHAWSELWVTPCAQLTAVA